MATAAAWLTTAATSPSDTVSGLGGGWPGFEGWIVLAVVALPVVGKVIVVWLALRNTAPGQRPPIITALADLLQPRGRSRRGPAA